MASALPAEPMPDGPMSYPGRFTVEEWLALPTEQRVELIDGSYVVSPSPLGRHQLCTKRLVRLLDDAAPQDLEVVEATSVICGDNGLIPDVMVADAETIMTADIVEPQHVHLVAEVVSPGGANRRRDYEVKPRIYAEAGIPAFLRIELTGPGAPRVEAFALTEGRYASSASAIAGETLKLAEPYEIAFDPAVLAGPRRT